MDKSAPSFFATPAIRTEDMTDSEWETELQLMLNRSEATNLYERGEISPQDFEDALATFGIPDPYRLDDVWMARLKCRGLA